jgi:hypothetical protein
MDSKPCFIPMKKNAANLDTADDRCGSVLVRHLDVCSSRRDLLILFAIAGMPGKTAAYGLDKIANVLSFTRLLLPFPELMKAAGSPRRARPSLSTQRQALWASECFAALSDLRRFAVTEMQ